MFEGLREKTALKGLCQKTAVWMAGLKGCIRRAVLEDWSRTSVLKTVLQGLRLCLFLFFFRGTFCQCFWDIFLDSVIPCVWFVSTGGMEVRCFRCGFVTVDGFLLWLWMMRNHFFVQESVELESINFFHCGYFQNGVVISVFVHSSTSQCF